MLPANANFIPRQLLEAECLMPGVFKPGDSKIGFLVRSVYHEDSRMGFVVKNFQHEDSSMGFLVRNF